MRIGIFFGGPSREREISFAGGKTAFEHLDKLLFEPVPVFVDSLGRFIRVRPEVLYKTSIRDFYPIATQQTEGYRLYSESFPHLAEAPVPAEVGELILSHEFKNHFDFAFLAMHGPDCEDGAIQGLLEWYRIPYSGPGLMGSAVGIDKVLQNDMIALANGQEKKTTVLGYDEWQTADRVAVFERVKQELGIPIVVKAPHQGSSIGVAIVQKDDFDTFSKAVNQCFFQLELTKVEWSALSDEQKKTWGQQMANLDEGIGFPVVCYQEVYYHPTQLIEFLDNIFGSGTDKVQLSSSNAEDQVLLETFVRGQEFSCGCIQLDNGTPFALPPTEVIKFVEVFDFNSKYKLGTTRKRIPVDTTYENNQKIREQIALVFGRLGMTVCARIDGFLTPEGEVLLHDPNTIPGMSPTSLIFKQMAEIGLNVPQSITYFIRQSIRERIRNGKDTWGLRNKLKGLDQAIQIRVQNDLPHEGLLFQLTDSSYAEARRQFGHLFAAGACIPVPVLQVNEYSFYVVPVQLMFKDYIEDVLKECEKVRDEVLTITAKQGETVTAFYAGKVDYQVKKFRSINKICSIENWTKLS
jgi:D-alanine-D-alanine ligase